MLRHIFGRALTREEVIADWMPKRTRPDADARGIGYWVGFVAGVPVGWWSLYVDDSDPAAAELGYRLRRDAWGQGLATEGARALLEHGFLTVGLERIWAETMAVNLGSQAVMQRCGLTFERRYVGEWEHPVEGADQGEVVYAISRSAYVNRQ